MNFFSPLCRNLRSPQAHLLSRTRRLSSTQIFDPFVYQATQLPLGQARSLPGHVYYNQEWHREEVKHLLEPSWVLAGRVDELPKPGSFLRLDLPGGASTLIVRGKDLQIKAWANVCTHRGAALTRCESGQFAGGIVCPYHAWTYDPTTGALKGVPKGQDMSSCFRKSDWPLQAVRVEEYKGFLFVTASDATPALGDTLGNLSSALRSWPLEEFVCVGRREYSVDCNWKFLMQNTAETYHTAVVHRDSLGPMTSQSIADFLGEEPVGHWDAVHVPGERSVVPLPGEPAPFPELPRMGKGKEKESTYFISLFPTLQLNVTRDCAWWMRVLPVTATSSRVTMGFLFPRATAGLENFQELLQPYLHRWDVAVCEDNEISVNQQRASESPYHRPGPYHSLEVGVHRFDRFVLNAVLGGVAEQGCAGVAPQLAPPNRPEVLPRSRQVAPTLTASRIATATATSMRGATRKQSQRPMCSSSGSGSGRGSSSGARSSTSSSSQGAASSSGLAPGGTACVTGANGFIALHLVEQLLASGHRVVAAVRTADPQKLAPLRALGALGELKVVEGCDLLVPGSFAEAVAEAEVCFHTASPFWMDERISEPWAQLVQPAERGTMHVLDSCAQEGCRVRRVVLTSSFAAAMNVGGRSPWPLDFTYTEEHWNVSSAPDAQGLFPAPVNAHAYRWSKTLAEKAAWSHEAVASGKLDLATILPPMVLGENRQRLRSLKDLNQSSLLLQGLLSGSLPHVLPGSVGFVDVADVAKAHLLAAQLPRAAGQRYLCSGETRTWLEVVALLRELYPSAPLPTTCEDGSTVQPCLHLANDKIRADLGMEFIPLKQTLKAQADALVQAGLLAI